MQNSNPSAGPVPASSSAATDPQERQAREYLAAGRFRKARDEFKLLCKRDRSRFLTLLIEANIGLAREMLGKGMVSEAQQVMAYLRTIAPPAALQSLEGEMAGAAGDRKALMIRALEALANPPPSLPQSERIRLADQAVLAFEPVPPGEATETAPTADLRAVHAALRAVSDSQFEKALEQLRPIPQASPFAHWKLFIKGLVAFHKGEREKAARFLSELPVDSIPSRASQPYQSLSGGMKSGDSLLSERSVQMIGQSAGHPNLGRSLFLAEKLWRNHAHAESYKVLRQALPQFPGEGRDVFGALSEFYFNAIFTLPEKSACRYSDFFGGMIDREHAKNPVERKLALRLLCLFQEPVIGPSFLQEEWAEFIDLHEQLHGANPPLASLAYSWLGNALAKAQPQPFYFGPSPIRFRDRPGAMAALEKSIAFDPCHLAPHLKLCELYEALKMTSQRNRLLDAMTVRFPDRKEVLLQAGRGCLDRQAFHKGLEYLERALELDRLDPAIPDAMAIGRIRLALQFYRKGRLDQARPTWERLQELVLDKPDDWTRSRWCLLTRRGLMERLFGDAAQGEALLLEARAGSPFPGAFLFFAHLAERVYSPQAQSGWAEEFKALTKGDACAGHAVTLFHIFRYWKLLLEDAGYRNEEAILRKYLQSATHRDFTRDEASRLITVVGPDPQFTSEVQAFIKRILRDDPKDPLFRMFRIATGPAPAFPEQVASARQEAREILDEATRRGDENTMKIARSFLAGLEQHSPMPGVGAEPYADEEPDDEPWDDDSDISGVFPDVSPKDMAGMASVMDLLANASEADFRAMRKHPPKGVPKEFLDVIIDLARSGAPFPPLPKFGPPSKPDRKPPPVPTPTKPPPPPKAKSDPNQPDFF